MRLILFLFVFPWGLWGQTTHSATLTWMDTANPAGTTYTVYRGSVACSASPAFTKLASAVTVTNYVDNTVQVGTTYCYQVTATNTGIESQPSNQVSAPVPPFPPANVTVTVQ